MVNDPNWRTRRPPIRGLNDEAYAQLAWQAQGDEVIGLAPPQHYPRRELSPRSMAQVEEFVAGQDILPQVPRMRERQGVTERERANRRRRREAIVINEGGGPVTQGDIIQRPVGSS
jgi:hypothetical protein